MSQMESNRPSRPPAHRARDRSRHLVLATAARRRLDEDERTRGRAWVNGREVGGPDARFAHLGRSHD